MLRLLSSSCLHGRLRISCSRLPDGAPNVALEKSPLFRVIRSSGEKTLFRLTSLFSSESGEGDGSAKSVDAKAAEEAEYATTGSEAEEAKASSVIVPTIPRPQDQLTVMVVPLPHRPLFPGFYMPVSIKDSKLLSALAETCKRSVTYAGAFLFKDEPGTDPSLVSGTETEKNIYDFKGQELFNRLHDIGTLVQISSIQGNDVYLLGHCRLQKTEMDGEEPLTVKVDHLKDLPYNKDDDVIKATNFEVISTLRDVLKISSVWREYAKTYSRYVGDFTDGSLADFGAALSMANKLFCQQVLEELDVHRRLKLTLGLIKNEIEINKIQESMAKAIEEKLAGEQRRYLLNEQLKAIKKVDELIDIGEKAGGDTEVDKVVIDVSNLADYVGMPVFRKEE